MLRSLDSDFNYKNGSDFNHKHIKYCSPSCSASLFWTSLFHHHRTIIEKKRIMLQSSAYEVQLCIWFHIISTIVTTIQLRSNPHPTNDWGLVKLADVELIDIPQQSTGTHSTVYNNTLPIRSSTEISNTDKKTYWCDKYID